MVEIDCSLVRMFFFAVLRFLQLCSKAVCMVVERFLFVGWFVVVANLYLVENWVGLL